MSKTANTAFITIIGAHSLTADLFWGAEHAIAFIERQEAVGEDGWLDEVWAEGGAVVDKDAKHFLLYGGEDLLYDVALRRVYLELLQSVWSGWTVRWAFEGIADLADYVDYPREKVLRSSEHETKAVSLAAPPEKDWTETVGSVKLENGAFGFFPLQGGAEEYLGAGLPLLEEIRGAESHDKFDLGEWTVNFPSGGFHLDLTERTIDFWTAGDKPDVENRIRRRWAGWRVRWSQDKYETQLASTAGLLKFPVFERGQLIFSLRQMLLRESWKNPVESFAETTEMLKQAGRDVEKNAWAMKHEELPLEIGERRRIFERAVNLIE